MSQDPSLIDELLAVEDAGVNPVIRAVGLTKVYRSGTQETHALRGASLVVHRGEYISIMGPSGSGKSTLFNLIGALSRPTTGKVYIDQVDISQLDHDELAWLRCRKIGYIFQSYNLLQVMTCLENVMLPMAFAGLDSDSARDKAAWILERVGLGHRLLHKPAELSGGQQQRCAIARALANSPDIVLADEPTGNLDLKTGEEMIELLSGLKTELGVTVISATHDHKMLKRSDRILWINDGLIVKDGKPADLDLPLAAQPAHSVRRGSGQASPTPSLPRKESPGTPEVIIAAQGVKRLYIVGNEEVWALKGLDLEIYRGEFLSIMGPSGSGKSTFFNQLGALDVPTEGKVLFEGQSLFDLPERQQAWVRNRKLGYIFQNYNLIGVMTALENVMLPATFSNDSKAEAKRKATEVLEWVGLSHRLTHKPGELSGGQQQRVAVARALVNNPEVILADEPTANLDSKTGGELIELLGQLNRERGVTIVCATHDHKMLQASQRICSIRDGRLEKISTGEQFRLEEMHQDKTGLRS